ncbi:MAG: hypothetical protein ACJA2S_002943 [Cyclobacteriaceae bacterium]|jgi:hypothetical protein
MKFFLVCFLLLLNAASYGQSIGKLILQGDYTSKDSVEITHAYLNANQAVMRMATTMESIWYAAQAKGQTKAEARIEHWKKDQQFVTWLGQPEKIGLVRRRINKIYSKYEKTITLEVTKENKGRCKGWISAWTIPYGRVKIRLCEDYLRYRTHLHEKTLIHELGHEAGMLLHRRIHGCWRALRAAESTKDNLAKRNPENYAWLAMSYLGLECGLR